MADRGKKTRSSKKFVSKSKKTKSYFSYHDCTVPHFILDPFDYPMSSVKRFFLKCFTANEHHRLHKTYTRSSYTLIQEKYRHIRLKYWFVIHPFSLFAGVMHCIMFVCFVIDWGNIPFYKSRVDFRNSQTLILPFVIECCTLLVCFALGYIDESAGEIILDLRQIGKKYLSTWFVIDFIAVFPWKPTIVGIYKVDEATEIHLHVFDITQLFFLRSGFFHLKHALEFLVNDPSLIRFYKMIVIFIYFIHCGSCLQSYLPYVIHAHNLPNVSESWLNNRIDDSVPFPREYSASRIYLASLFRTLTQAMSHGYGVAFPETPEDAYLTMFIVLLGRVFYFYIIQESLSYHDWVKCPKVKYFIMMGHVNQFMRRRQLPALMQKKIRMFYEYRFQRTYFKEKQILATISDRLREEIRVHECRKLVEESRLFGSLPSEVVDRVTRCFKQDVYLPNDIIIKVGNFGDCMFFLSRGTVAVISRSGEELAHLYDGAFFGELALISSEERRLATVIAVEISEVYRLEREDFQSLVRPLPSVFRQIRLVAEYRLQHMLEMERVGRSSIKRGSSERHSESSSH